MYPFHRSCICTLSFNVTFSIRQTTFRHVITVRQVHIVTLPQQTNFVTIAFFRNCRSQYVFRSSFFFRFKNFFGNFDAKIFDRKKSLTNWCKFIWGVAFSYVEMGILSEPILRYCKINYSPLPNENFTHKGFMVPSVSNFRSVRIHCGNILINSQYDHFRWWVIGCIMK